MTDILHLPGWMASKTRINGDEMIIEAEYVVPATACIKCGVVDRRLITGKLDGREI